MLTYDSIRQLVDAANSSGRNISELVLEDQAIQLGKTKEQIFENMSAQFKVMLESLSSGFNSNIRSPSGMSGGDALRMKAAVDGGKSLSGRFLGMVLANALAVSEVNACMGRIVAAPTAGSCGILPSVLITMMKEKNIPEEKVVMSLFTSAGFGMVIAKKASISGAEGGCMAECGCASAMAAAAAVEIAGGTPQMSAQACAIAIKNTLGLVCDPVAGLVEVPCIKRNAAGAANAIVAAELALAGVESIIPADEVIEAMKAVGEALPASLKETAAGGLAETPSAKRIARAFFG